MPRPSTRPPDEGDPPRSSLRRWRRRLADERLEADVYRELAARRTGEEREILLALAEAESRHAAHWEALLGEHAAHPAKARPGSRALAFLARRFGSVFVLALAQAAEARSPYGADRDATPTMAADERVHEEVIRGLAARGRARVSGSFRAAVFGANDGLVSNLALVAGVSAGGAGSTAVLLTGLAGMLSGALSMGAGEYVSVRSQRELLEASVPTPVAPTALGQLDVDANELALVYRARGMDPVTAERRANDRLLGLASASFDDTTPADRHDVVGSALCAAASSFGFFAAGAVVPVLPFLLGLTAGSALVVAAVLVGAALLATGAVVGMLSGGPPLRRALRQLAIGAGAAVATYALGAAFGAVLG
jgi:VIT1/CCC1 family predicted Fe2+/Mn2+ transporter